MASRMEQTKYSLSDNEIAIKNVLHKAANTEDEKAIKKQLKKLQKFADLLRKESDRLQSLAKKDQLLAEAKYALELAEKNLETLHNIAKKLAEELEKHTAELRLQLYDKTRELILGTIANTLLGVLDKVDSIAAEFIEMLESMAYNLSGTGDNLSSIISTITSSLNGSGYVKEQDVVKNLNTLLSSGIVRDVELRAFLQALADDLGMTFNQEQEDLNRVISILDYDLSANRLAILASLKEFLNQNYQTSLYIKNGFEQVSNALLEAQSMMSASAAVAFEALVQTWLGSLYSAGLSSSAMSSLANALNQLGSGNIAQLNGTEMLRLLIMGANVSDNAYGDLLLNGLTAENTLSLLEGIVSYVSGEIYGNNNVVTSELGRVFGLSVADVKAIANYAKNTGSGTISTDISEALLNKLDKYQYTTTRMSNMLDNLVYTAGALIGSNEALYVAYKMTELLSDTIAPALEGTTLEVSPLGIGVSTEVASIIKALPEVFLATQSMGNMIQALLSGNVFKSASQIYLSMPGTKAMAATGAVFGLNEGSLESGTLVMNTNASDATQAAYNQSASTKTNIVTGEDEPTKSIDDIWTITNKINDNVSGLKNLPNAINKLTAALSGSATSAGDTTAVSVSISTDDLTTVKDATIDQAMNIRNILNILEAWYRENGTSSYSGYYHADSDPFRNNSQISQSVASMNYALNTKDNKWVGTFGG